MADKTKNKVKETAENLKHKMRHEHNGQEEKSTASEGNNFA